MSAELRDKEGVRESGSGAVTVLSLDEARGADRDLLGGKGESLVRIRELGLPVPPAFIVTTEVFRRDGAAGELDEGVWEEIVAHADRLGRELGRGLGDPDAPLLVSVRSGAPVSMPGMLETILNVGLTDEILPRVAEELGADAARDAYERLRAGYTAGRPGEELPEDAWAQLRGAVEAVLASWSSPRAVRYRRHRGIDESLGTAVVVQAMVFGNLRERSGTGVAFTRDPATGAPGIYGDFLAGAQGEDLVAGERSADDLAALRELGPDLLGELERAGAALEASFADLCDIEFTVERGRLWILQARPGQRTPLAAVRIALDLVEEGVIDRREAIARIAPEGLIRLLDPVLELAGDETPLASGVPASPGAAVGRAAFSSLEAEERAAAGEDVILLRPTTSPRDFAGMVAARGIVTARGGRTSHAAVVARGISKPAVCAVAGLELGADEGSIAGRVLRPGDELSIDGGRGVVYSGALPLADPGLDPRVERLLGHCDAERRVPVLAVDAAAEWADGVLDRDAPRIERLEDLERLGDARRAIVAPVERDGAAAVITRAAELDGVDLVLEVPEAWPPSLHALPPGRWVAVAATERCRLAARLLAATVEVRGG